MVEVLFLAAILSITPLCKYPIKYGNGFALKEALFYTVGILYACKVLLFGGGYAASLPGQILFLYMILSLASMMWCTNVEQGWQDVPKWIAMYVLFSLASSVPVKTVLLLSAIPIPFYLAYGFSQSIWPKRDFFDKDIVYGKFISTGGNTNHTAAFLAPYVFVNLWLSVHVSAWFIPLVILTLLGIHRTKCYGARAGIAVGLCFVAPPYSFLGFVVIGLAVAFILALRKWNKEAYAEWAHSGTGSDKEKSLTSRVYYCIVAYHLWKKCPVFGWGLRAYRKEIYDLQAQFNGKYKDLVTQHGVYNAFPQRVHNDLMEALVEHGAIGFLLLAGFMATVVTGAALSGNYILLAGIVCLIVNGMLFYTLSSFSCVPWMFIAACASGSTVSAISLPFAAGLIISAFLVKLCLAYVVKPHLSSMWLARANKDDSLKWKNHCIDKALNLTPTDGATVSSAIKVKAQGDIFLAEHFAERAVHHYDGTMKAWGTWGVYGELLWKTGNWEGAKRALRYSLYLDPSFESSKIVLGMIEAKEKEVIEAQKAKQERMEQFKRLANGRAA